MESSTTNSSGSMEIDNINMDNMEYFLDVPTTSAAAAAKQNKMRMRIGATKTKKSWRFQCDKCDKSYRTKGELKNHMDIHLNPTKCLVCKKVFKNASILERHTKLHEEVVYCQKCEINVSKLDWGHHLRTRAHKQTNGMVVDFSENVKLKSSDFMERIEIYTYTPKKPIVIAEEFFGMAEEEVLNILIESLTKHINFKVNFELECLYIKDSADALKMEKMSHVTKMMPVTCSDVLSNIYQEKILELKAKMSEFQERDSGWALYQISFLNININQHKIIRGSNYIELPPRLARLNACTNINNGDDSYCFKWCIIAAIKKISNKKQVHEKAEYEIQNIDSEMILVNGVILNFKNMKFPVDLKEISIFEAQNTFISINVFGYDKNGKQIVGPYRKCDRTRQIHISLLLLENDDFTKRHYILIKDLSR